MILLSPFQKSLRLQWLREHLACRPLRVIVDMELKAMQTLVPNSDKEYKEREKQKNVTTDKSDDSIVHSHASTNNGIITNTPLQVGKEVYIKSIGDPTLVVAKGWLCSLDPLTVVGGIEIGTDLGEVNIQVAIKRDEQLIRPFDLVNKIVEATGVVIAWPCSLISVVPLD
ncbi:uncharacterized protein [Rutidosis leptorrhynchoides]|uniref:uncharacterized protein n=1 Tax=Rutidosis leptorrhynchoides TaxID=125765 RepID=UPI003A9A4165